MLYQLPLNIPIISASVHWDEYLIDPKTRTGFCEESASSGSFEVFYGPSQAVIHGNLFWICDGLALEWDPSTVDVKLNSMLNSM